MIRMKKILLLSLLYLLSGCAHLKNNIPEFGTHHAQLLGSWQARGSLAEHAQSHYGMNASFIWRQKNQNQYELMLLGPLGSYPTLIRSVNGRATIRTQKNTYYLVRSGMQFWRNRNSTFSIKIPILQMPYWLRGLPAPNGAHSMRWNTNGTLRQLQQFEWTIDYLSWTSVKNQMLPKQLTMHNSYQTLNLLIYQWII